MATATLVRDHKCGCVPLPLRCRPLATLSAMLSAAVPRNRCAGLQQAGLSQ
jgi:hypothetical protein